MSSVTTYILHVSTDLSSLCICVPSSFTSSYRI